MRLLLFLFFCSLIITGYTASSYLELDAIFSQIDWKMEQLSTLLERQQLEKQESSRRLIQSIVEQNELCSSLEDIFLRDIIQNQLRMKEENWQRIMQLIQEAIQAIERIRADGSYDALRELRVTMRQLKRTMRLERSYKTNSSNSCESDFS